MTRIVYLRRRGETFTKGHGVEVTLPNGQRVDLSHPDHHAPHDVDYNPFFHDSSTGRMRTDVEHKWPKEAQAERILKHLMKAIQNGHTIMSYLTDERGQRYAMSRPDDIMRNIHAAMNATIGGDEGLRFKGFNDECHPDHKMPFPMWRNGELNPEYKQYTVGNWQARNVQTADRATRLADGRHQNFNAGNNKISGHDHTETATNHENHQQTGLFKLLGWDQHTSVGTRPHIEPGTMLSHAHRHAAPPAGGGTRPGTFTPREQQARANQTREGATIDPFNIIFGSEGATLPKVFFATSKTRTAGNVLERLNGYGIEGDLADAMAHTAVGQLLLGRARHGGSAEKEGKRSVPRLSRLVNEMRRATDTQEGGENHDLFNNIRSHLKTNPNLEGGGQQMANDLAAMLYVAKQRQIDLSGFGGENVDQQIRPGVVDAFQRIAPQIAQGRGGTDHVIDWDAPAPERRHVSGNVPQPSAVADGPPVSRVPRMGHMPHSPIEERPPMPPPVEERPPPMATRMMRPTPDMRMRQPSPDMQMMPDPIFRLMRAMEDMQLADARRDDSIMKHLPTKRDLNIHNAQDVSLMASRLGVTSGDIHGLYASGGDWERVAKEFRVAPALVAAVKVAFS